LAISWSSFWIIKGAMYRDCEVVTASQFCNLSNISKASPHNDCLVSVLLIVIEDGLHAPNTRVVLRGVVLLCRSFVPVQDTANEGRDQEGARFGSGDCLGKREHQSQIAIDTVLLLQDLGRFDAFPSRSELDEDSLLANALVFVEL